MTSCLLAINNPQTRHVVTKTYGKKKKNLFQQAMKNLAFQQQRLFEDDILAYEQLYQFEVQYNALTKRLAAAQSLINKKSKKQPLPLERLPQQKITCDITLPKNHRLVMLVKQFDDVFAALNDTYAAASLSHDKYYRQQNTLKLTLLQLLSNLVAMRQHEQVVTLADYLASQKYDNWVQPARLFQALHLDIAPKRDRQALKNITQQLNQKIQQIKKRGTIA